VDGAFAGLVLIDIAKLSTRSFGMIGVGKD
jgi:hypothetical protein